MLRDLIRFLWRHDSESASVIIIHLAEFLTIPDMNEMGEYLKSYAANRKARPLLILR